MLNELRDRIDEFSGKFNKDIEHKKEPVRNEEYSN